MQGLHEVPGFDGAVEPIPAKPRALWCWLRGEDRGELLHRGRHLSEEIADAFALDSVTDAFRHREGRDLTGYEDGTENPRDAAAADAAIVINRGPGLDGSSFVAVQNGSTTWVASNASPDEQDAIIGRRREDNVELADAPSSSHVKRTAQESFDPTAFLLRRSMPWIDGKASGLMFVAFGRSLFRLRGKAAPDDWTRRRHQRCTVPLLAPHQHQLLLVPAGLRGPARPAGTWPLKVEHQSSPSRPNQRSRRPKKNHPNF